MEHKNGRTTFLAMEHKNRRTTFLAMEHKNRGITFLAMENKNRRIVTTIWELCAYGTEVVLGCLFVRACVFSDWL